MTNRAKNYVEDKIAQNDIGMVHVLFYYLSIRLANEMLAATIANTLQHDQQLKDTKEYYEILPPISQSNEDMSYALVSFINALFTKEQINAMNNHSALLFLKNRLIKIN
jgi:hypothetical protein